jgi:hypothetical protein
MKVTKSYLKQVIKEELGRMEEGGVPIGSSKDRYYAIGYTKSGEPDYVNQAGALKGVIGPSIDNLKTAYEFLKKGDIEKAKPMINDVMRNLDTILTAFDPINMVPRQENN